MKNLSKAAIVATVLLMGTDGGAKSTELDVPIIFDSPFGALGGRENNEVSPEELYISLEQIGVTYKRLSGPQALAWGFIEAEMDGDYLAVQPKPPLSRKSLNRIPH